LLNIVTVKHMKLSKLVITGCDSKTNWQLEWFQLNYWKHNLGLPLQIFDFDTFAPELRGWFKKPAAMIEASKMADKVIWLDTDCEVRTSIDDMFDLIVPNKLCMVEDKPWTTRTKETWHNSGVVGFEDCPAILDAWYEEVKITKGRGDQEVLHSMCRDGMTRLIHIHDLPHSYNTLRLDLLDNTAPKDIKIMHWTGAKGNEEIRKQMND
jgi:hypothetical protein